MKSARLLAITLLLQARGKLTATELGRVLEVSERTIYRDIAALGEARVPVVAESGPEGGYSLIDGYRVDATLFSGEEAVSLAIGGAILHGLQEATPVGVLRQALAKIEAALPPEYREAVRAGQERFLFDAAQWYAGAAQPDVHLPILRGAVLHGRRVRLHYLGRDATQSEEREVDPLGLVYKAGTWYLIGFCHSRCALRTFRLGRILAAEPLAVPRGEYPTFDLARYWEENRARLEVRGSYMATVRAVPALAVELLGRPYTFHYARRFADGSLEASLDLESLELARAFALSCGPDLEVLEPAELRALVIASASAIVSRYQAAARAHT